MSEVLARIRVRETHGIRRFLYPLTAYVSLPEGTDISKVGLVDDHHIPIPSQVTFADENYRLDFAVSLDPQSEIDLTLLSGTEPKIVDDPLQLDMLGDNSLQSTQKQFAVTISEDGNVQSVVYDDVAHLGEPTEIRRPDLADPRYVRGLIGRETTEKKLRVNETKRGGGSLAAWSEVQGDYTDGCKAFIQTEITACKSWIMTRYRLEGHVQSEGIIINIPFQATSSRLYFDTGIGDGIYGRVSSAHVGFGWVELDAPQAITKGYVCSARGRSVKTDYIAPIRADDLPSHCWFHLVDHDKAVAVAITKLPTGCTGCQIKTNKGGWIEIALELNPENEGSAEFGVCYHFLNDVPAIAAATNPQSILLPPVVEVLPV